MPSLATMPPVHDYPRAMAETNRRDLTSTGNNKSDEHHGLVALSKPHSNQKESWTDVAFMILFGLILAAMSMLLQVLVLAYFLWIMKRHGVVF